MSVVCLSLCDVDASCAGCAELNFSAIGLFLHHLQCRIGTRTVCAKILERNSNEVQIMQMEGGMKK